MLAETPSLRASWMKTGIITTTTGVLLTKAEAIITKAINAAIASAGRASACASAIWVNQWSAPVRVSAPITMNIAAMVQGAGLAKTSSA